MELGRLHVKAEVSKDGEGEGVGIERQRGLCLFITTLRSTKQYTGACVYWIIACMKSMILMPLKVCRNHR